MRKTVIIGGGLAGLVSAIQLVRAGFPCTVIEKKSYPFHRVCGEYISNEALPFLKRNGLFPDAYEIPRINRFQLSSTDGQKAQRPLDLGGFGISRFTFDHHLYQIAKSEGVEFLLNTEVSNVAFAQDQFEIFTSVNKIHSDVILGCFGKRSKLDQAMQRTFIRKRSPYVGVKYHIRTDHPRDVIALHNFKGGYCGISQVENNITNLCYLVHRDVMRKHGEIAAMEKEVLQKNPLLKYIFLNSEFLFRKPEVINEISFEPKTPVEGHIVMAGDAAGMIAPLCGNGMAMAIHSAALAFPLITDFLKAKINRAQLEEGYASKWQKFFAARLFRGRIIQGLFGSGRASQFAVQLMRQSGFASRMIMRSTHGQPF